MIAAKLKFIGPMPLLIGSILFVVGGIVMLAIGIANDNTALLIAGIVVAVAAAVLALDALVDLRALPKT